MGSSRLGMFLSIFLSVLEEIKVTACPLVVTLDFSPCSERVGRDHMV